ncbi:MAG TPA: alkaline phosphatase D family protein [Chthoniobacterales bacterium]|jgi:alkaline phosphatase D|nr:alkaline phosphatase D family protein [Chthoniobacterales bacterium]
MRGKLAFLLALALGASASFGQDSGPPLERIAFGSCNREYKPQPLWSAIRACQPNLWIWLGDNVYGSAYDLPDLARRYQTEKNQPDYKSLREQCRVLGVWDDNDYGVSDGGKENRNKVACQQLLLDFLDEPPDSPRRKQAGVYAAYTFGPLGKRVKIILLDGRYHRDSPGRNADMLGPEQWQWLEQQLTSRDADVNLIGSGIQVIASEHPYEKWADFPSSRARLFDLISKSGARNVIFLSGDRHLGEISRLSDPRIAQPIYDITSSGMTHHARDNFFHSFTHETNRFRCGNNFVDLNFGFIHFDWDTVPRTVTLQIRDTNNAVRIEEKLTLAASTP